MSLSRETLPEPARASLAELEARLGPEETLAGVFELPWRFLRFNVETQLLVGAPAAPAESVVCQLLAAGPLRAGELLALLGLSGASGQTILFKLLAGLQPKTVAESDGAYALTEAGSLLVPKGLIGKPEAGARVSLVLDMQTPDFRAADHCLKALDFLKPQVVAQPLAKWENNIRLSAKRNATGQLPLEAVLFFERFGAVLDQAVRPAFISPLLEAQEAAAFAGYASVVVERAELDPGELVVYRYMLPVAALRGEDGPRFAPLPGPDYPEAALLAARAALDDPNHPARKLALSKFK